VRNQFNDGVDISEIFDTPIPFKVGGVIPTRTFSSYLFIHELCFAEQTGFYEYVYRLLYYL
jgi:hypothetical protein